MLDSTGQILFTKDQLENPIEEGKKEAAKDLVKEEETNKKKLNDLIEKSNVILLKIISVFPLDIFPTEVIIDENKVSLINHQFFWSERIHSVIIRDISDVYVETSLIFTTLIIIDEGFSEEEIKIPYLWKKDALEARKIIQGLIVSIKGANTPMLGGIGLSGKSPKDLITKIRSLGSA